MGGALVGAALVSGCASFSADGGFDTVARAVQGPLSQAAPTAAPPRWARSEQDREQMQALVAQRLRAPLSLDAAVQVALLNNRGLQADFEELGIAEADLVQASRLPNPGLSLGRVTRGDEVEIERGLHLNLMSLIALPMRRQIEQRRFAQAQGRAAARVLELAADTRRAWVQAVAARQTLQYAQQVMDAAQASAELARRMAEVGNFNKLQQAREQAFQAEAALGLARAEQAHRAARERLTRLLGLWGAQAEFTLPDRLPDLPATPRELPEVERTAIAQRLDVQGARLLVDQSARQAQLAGLTRWGDELALGLARNSSNEAPVQRAVEIEFTVPLFDLGDARRARAAAAHAQAVHRAAQLAIDARSEVREAYGAYRTAFDIARFQRDEVVPLKKRISEENLLRYNGMLIGVFELLADARAQIAAVNGAIEALRDFWLAQADLDHALVGKPQLAAMAAVRMAADAPDAGGH